MNIFRLVSNSTDITVVTRYSANESSKYFIQRAQYGQSFMKNVRIFSSATVFI